MTRRPSSERPSSVSDHPTLWRTSQQVEHGASPIEAVEQLGRRLWRAEVRLAESRRMIAESNRQLHDVYGSTSWRLTAPLRRFSDHHASSARLLRRGAKLAWWTASLQLRRRLRERRLAIAEAERAERATAPGVLRALGSGARHPGARTSPAWRGSTARSTARRSSRCSCPSSTPPNKRSVRRSSRSARRRTRTGSSASPMTRPPGAARADSPRRICGARSAGQGRPTPAQRRHLGGLELRSRTGARPARRIARPRRSAATALAAAVGALRSWTTLALASSTPTWDRVDVEGRRISHYFKPD